MPSTYTQNLGLEKPGTGEQAGTWGVTANTNYDTLDKGVNGNLSIPLSASTYNLATQQGGPAAQGINKVIIWTGTLASQGSVNITPNTAQKFYVMQNKTGGGYAVVFQQGTGAAFTLQPGYTAVICCDGLGAGAGVFQALDSPQFVNVLVQGNLSVQGNLTYSGAQTINQPMTFAQPVTCQSTAALTSVSIAAPGHTAATGDIYYRDSSGILVPLAIGAPGQVLSVLTGPSLAWSTPGLNVGTGIGGSVPYGIYFSNASNVLAQDGYVLVNPGTGIGLGMVPSHTLHIGLNRPPEIWLDAANAGTQTRQLIFATNGSPRWQLFSPAVAESGSNHGSDLALLGYNDAASAARYVLYMSRLSANLGVGPGGDLGARLGVLNDVAGQPCLLVRGAASQSAQLTTWQNSAGTQLASVDAAGNFSCADATVNNLTINGSLTAPNAGLLQLNSAGRLDIHGTVAGHPLGTLHVGVEPQVAGKLSGSIVLENAQGTVDNLPAGCCRIYTRNGYFVIQFNSGGTNYWLTVQIVGTASPAVWNINPAPVA